MLNKIKEKFKSLSSMILKWIKENKYWIIGILILILLIVFYFKCEWIDQENNKKFSNIYVGVIASILTACILYIGQKLIKYSENRDLKLLFGFNDNFSLIVPEFKVREDVLSPLPSSVKNIDFPLKHLKNNTNAKSSGLFGYVDVRAANYMSKLVYNKLNGKSELISDNRFQNDQGCSYIAFGSTNLYFKGIINEIIKDFNIDSVTGTINYEDYGLIVKYKDNNDIIRIGVGGYGESGTSGAAWYLSTNWKSIKKEYRSNSFAILIGVNKDDDSSAKEITSVKISKDNENEIIDFFKNVMVQKIINHNDMNENNSNKTESNKINLAFSYSGQSGTSCQFKFEGKIEPSDLDGLSNVSNDNNPSGYSGNSGAIGGNGTSGSAGTSGSSGANGK